MKILPIFQGGFHIHMYVAILPYFKAPIEKRSMVCISQFRISMISTRWGLWPQLELQILQRGNQEYLVDSEPYWLC